MRIIIKEQGSLNKYILDLKPISECVYKCEKNSIELIDIDSELTHYEHRNYYKKGEFIKAIWMQFIHNQELKNVHSFCYLD